MWTGKRLQFSKEHSPSSKEDVLRTVDCLLWRPCWICGKWLLQGFAWQANSNSCHTVSALTLRIPHRPTLLFTISVSGGDPTWLMWHYRSPWKLLFCTWQTAVTVDVVSTKFIRLSTISAGRHFTSCIRGVISYRSLLRATDIAYEKKQQRSPPSVRTIQVGRRSSLDQHDAKISSKWR